MIASPLAHAADPDLMRILRTYNDVTERLKQSHEALAAEVCRLRGEINEKNRELQRRERLAALGEMAAGVAHEIRNPLGGIGLFASLLERDLVELPAQQSLAKKIRAGVQSTEAIVRDILAFAGGAAPRLRRTSVFAVVRSAIKATDMRAQATGSHITVDASGDAVEVECDPAQLERAIVNLLLNAIEATPPEGEVLVRVCGDESELGWVSVIVEDEGSGIPQEHLQRIFNPFFTTKDAGTGLGLSIVHRIVDEHGGRVTAGNRERGGARMVISLPSVSPNQDSLHGGVE